MNKQFPIVLLLMAGMLAWTELPAQVPPASDPVVVATYCYHCGWIDLEKGENHRSDCPYVNGSGSGSSSRRSGSKSSSSYIDPVISQAITSMGYAAGEALGAAFDRSVENFYASSMVNYSGLRPGDTNGTYVTGRNGKHGSVGVFDNDHNTRWWKVPPVYKDLKIFDMSAIIALKKNGSVGVLDASGKRAKKIVPFEYDDFQVLGQRNGKGLVYALGVKDGEKMRWSIWNGNSRLIVDEFDNIRLTEEGIVAESGDRYMVYDIEGQLRTILVNRK